MSVSARRLRREGATGSSAPVTTSTAYWGRTYQFDGGVGWRVLKLASEASPAGMLIENALLLAAGYSQGLALMPDRTVQLWGGNSGGNLPWSYGPEGAWAGVWEYRTNLVKQLELEAEGHTKAEVEEKERTFAIRTSGQVIYLKGHIVTHEGGTWEALRENCAVKPGTDPTVWVPALPTIPQFKKMGRDGTERWFVYAYNLGAPRPAPMLHNVTAVVYEGAKGLALLGDGSIRQFGHGLRYGQFGTGLEGSYGPKPRPLKPPPPGKKLFRGTLTKGSAVITNLEETRASHSVSEGSEKLPWGQGSKTGEVMLMPEPFMELTGDAGTDVITMTVGPNLENGSAVKFSVLNGGAGLAANTVYYVVNASGKKVQLASTVGGAAINFTTNITAGTILLALGLPAGASVVGYTDHEVLDSEGHKYVPPKRKLDTITINEPAEYDYVGRMYGKLPTREQKYWTLKEGTLQSATWPMKPTIPAGVVCTAIASNGTSNEAWSFALTTAGEVLAWGSSVSGQMGDGGPVGLTHFNLLPNYVVGPSGTGRLGSIVAIASGESTILALDSAHKVWVWGNIKDGQAGKKRYEEKQKRSSTPVEVEGLPTTVGERPVAIACSKGTVFVLLEDATVMTLGTNQFGEAGNGTIGGKGGAPQVEPKRVVGLSNVKYLSAGRYHVAAVTTAGDVYTWGDNSTGELGIGSTGKQGGVEAASEPQKVDLGGLKALSAECGEYNTWVILEGSSAPPNRLELKLVPQGEETGEPSAYLRLRWKATAGWSGWRLTFFRQNNWWEEQEAEELKLEFEELLELAEWESTEEREEAEEELEVLDHEQEEREAGSTRFDITPTEVSPGVYEYEWISPGRLTPNSGYVVNLVNTAHSEWNPPQVFTNGLWGGPYV